MSERLNGQSGRRNLPGPGLGPGFDLLDLTLVILVVLIINCSYLSLLCDMVLLIRAISTFGVKIPGQSKDYWEAWHKVT